jgi:hypothetical protein
MSVVAGTVAFMYGPAIRSRALELVETGASLSDISRTTGIARSTIRSWTTRSAPVASECCRCEGAWPSAGAGYAALLGFYLGDGCISTYGRHTTFRVSGDADWPGIIADISRLVETVHPAGGVFHVRAPGAIVVHGNWKHWPCLFPQHGPGRKHERRILLTKWQEEVVIAFPADFLRGLFHSDGARVKNWATRIVGGERKRYDYARWQFSNRSDDIRNLCCWALDLADVAWRQSGPWTISVSRREAVAVLDELIGPKS